MSRCLVLIAAAVLFGWFVSLPAPSQAQVRPHECSYCHNLHDSGGGFIPLTIFDLDTDLCLSCHGEGGPPTFDGKIVPKGVAVHEGSLHTSPDVTTCIDCHDHFGETNGNLKLIPGVLNNRYTGFVDKLIDFTASANKSPFVEHSTPPYDGICQACHSSTSSYLSNGGGIHNYNLNCADCHTPTPTD